MSVSVETIKTQAASTGQLLKLSWSSPALGGLKTELNLFLPYPSSSLSPASAPSSSPSGIPVLLYLAGLECTADTGPQKAGVLNAAGKAGIALVFPDTSPRGAGMPGEEDDWDFGTSAGFYLNATAGKWAQHYRMYDFVVDEVPEVLGKQGYGLVSWVFGLGRLHGARGGAEWRRIELMDHTGFLEVLHLRSLDGRPRRAYALPQEPREIQVVFRLCTCVVSPPTPHWPKQCKRTR